MSLSYLDLWLPPWSRRPSPCHPMSSRVTWFWNLQETQQPTLGQTWPDHAHYAHYAHYTKVSRKPDGRTPPWRPVKFADSETRRCVRFVFLGPKNMSPNSPMRNDIYDISWIYVMNMSWICHEYVMTQNDSRFSLGRKRCTCGRCHVSPMKCGHVSCHKSWFHEYVMNVTNMSCQFMSSCFIFLNDQCKQINLESRSMM
jgi:hypothetical protein